MERSGTELQAEDLPRDWAVPLKSVDVLVFCLVMAILMPLVMGYTFGQKDQLEQLPLLYRGLNPSYCPHDFFLDASAEFDPRKYYSWFIAILSRQLPIPWIFLGLTIATNVALALVTYGTSRDVLNSSPAGGMIAVALVMATTGFTVGRPNLMLGAGYDYVLTPAGMASPVALAGLWAGFRSRPVICGILAAIACLIHPLIGAEVGVISLATALVVRVVRAWTSPAPMTGQTWLGFGFGTAIFGATFLLFWHHPTQSALGSKEFVDIVGRFRGPHQYIPSFFRRLGYITAGGLLLSFFISWRWWYEEARSREGPVGFLVPVFIILLLWVGGYIFVELIPSRLWITAQTFRLGGVLSWMCFLLFARSAARLLRAQGTAPAYGSLMLAGTGDAQAAVVLLGLFFGRVALTCRALPDLVKSWPSLAISVLATASLLTNYGDERQAAAMLAAGILALWFLLTRPSWWRNALPLALVFAVFFSCLIKGHRSARFLGEQVYVLKTDGSSADDIAVQARRVTPPAAVFLTPSEFARFRLLAERPIVIDFKCFPFGDRALLEWKRRLDDCYGAVRALGFDAVEEMNAHYRQMSQQRLLALGGKYGASYAVLYADTPCDLSVTCHNAEYKIVRLPDPTPVGTP